MDRSKTYPDQFWHCHVELTGNGNKKDKSAIFNDLSFEELEEQIVKPWHSGRPFTVDGMIVKDINDIQKIKVSNTAHPKSFYAEQHNNRMQHYGIADLATDRRLLPLSNGKDFTHDLLFKKIDQLSDNNKKALDTNSIFIVHGHDEQAKESSARFIEKLGLNAVILHEQANEGKTIIEKLEKHTDAAYAVVLFTPDDVGASASTPKNLQARARQNVLVELGYMAAKIGRNRVCVLRKGDVEIPSDFLGVLYIDVDSDGAWRLKLAKELKVAGLNIDLNDAM
jgi:predicted nucleotide-binding protein